MFSKCPVVCGAKNPLKLATVLVRANMAPACAGAKSKGLKIFINIQVLSYKNEAIYLSRMFLRSFAPRNSEGIEA